ncbi:MAG: hypothetical protein WCA84_07765 [Ignavibacteriaceae bacterium]|jgi:hypothetical protein
MSNENSSSDQKHHNSKAINNHDGGSAVYGLGLIGAAIYFIQHSATFLAGVIGILKAVIWPAIIVYKFLEFLKM